MRSGKSFQKQRHQFVASLTVAFKTLLLVLEGALDKSSDLVSFSFSNEDG